jgi:glycosyltransferase involved in cell wall biosynthesis
MENNIELSVVLPCLNEEEAVGICLKKIKEVFAKEGIEGEIIVADNGSTDRSRDIAASCGAKVVLEHTKGYGSAYLRGFKEAKGKYIIMADSDNTYDFYDIPKFLKALKSGYDLVMGSRFKGGIKKGAMSWSHRYLGNPVLSCMCRLFFHTRLSDIHCGMRAFTHDAWRKMKLQTLGMEFATEMVLGALTSNLKIHEVPIHYHPRKGESKLRSIPDAWRHIRLMLLYCPLWLYFIPGALGFMVGMLLLLLLLRGPVLFLGHYWGIHVMVFASMLSILSYQILNLGVYAHTLAIRQGFIRVDRLTRFFQLRFDLEKGLILGGIVSLLGFMAVFFIFMEWFFKDFGALYRIRESILAMTFLVIGLQTMFSSFFISLLFIEKRPSVS